MVGTKEWSLGTKDWSLGTKEWSFGEPVAKRQEMVSGTLALTINMAVAVRK